MINIHSYQHSTLNADKIKRQSYMFNEIFDHPDFKGDKTHYYMIDRSGSANTYVNVNHLKAQDSV